ncbi:MAG: DNA methyltransferase [Anaerolineaceae bacterium]|nr:DNA methyltransferase [Anaerolineaceae bacterium]
MTGDTVEVLPKLSRKHKFDVVIADPPYNIGKDFGSNWDQMPLENYVSWTKEWLGECLDLLKDTGVVYIYGFPEILAHVSVLFPVDEQRWLQWHYTNKTVPGSTFWQRSHESILCLWKPGWKRPQLEIDQIREPYTEQFLRNAAGKERAGTPSRFGSTGKRTIYVVHENGAMPRDVIKVPALAGGAGRSERWFLCRSCGGSIHPPAELKLHKDHDVLKHPTQKPKELTRRLLKSRVNGSGGRVLIPFAGSGSECVVAQELGISFLGIEINPEYASFAWQWLYTEKTGAANVQIDWQDAPEIRERFEEIS